MTCHVLRFGVTRSCMSRICIAGGPTSLRLAFHCDGQARHILGSGQSLRVAIQLQHLEHLEPSPRLPAEARARPGVPPSHDCSLPSLDVQPSD